MRDRRPRNDPGSDTVDRCFVRMSVLGRAHRDAALAQPVTDQLLVEGAGHFVDDVHGHQVVRPRRESHTRVYLCAGGSGRVQIGARQHVLDEGTMLVVPRGVAHSCSPPDRGWSLWWCALNGTEVHPTLRAMGVTPDAPTVPVQDSRSLVSVFDGIADEYEREHSPRSALRATASAWALLSRIGADRLATVSPGAATLAMNYLADNVERDIRVSDVADFVHLSQSRLHALFSEATGSGVRAYQIELRMERARRLLARTDLTVARIAHDVGYADPYYFSRLFRRMNGASPSAYRQGTHRRT